MEGIINFLTQPIFQKCVCPVESEEIQEYRSQFNFFNYYEKTQSFSLEKLESFGINIKSLEETCILYIERVFQSQETEKISFVKFKKLVPEPNTQKPLKVRTDTILKKDDREVIYEMYFIKVLDSWHCVLGNLIQ